MLAKIALLVGCVEAASFPGAAGSAASSIASVLNSANAGMQDNTAAIAAAVSSGTKKLSEAVANELSLTSLRSDAYILTHLSARRALHVGGCARDYSSACPTNFVEDGGVCVPGDGYSGPCGPQAVANKEDFAFKCGASWPCASFNSPTYSGCPSGWSAGADGSCLAGPGYTGICSPTTNFSGMSDAQKAQWSAFCSVSW